MRMGLAYILHYIGEGFYFFYDKFMVWSESVQGSSEKGPWKTPEKEK